MDLYWHAIMNLKWMKEYLEKHYWEIPRIRGIRFMEAEWQLRWWWTDIEEFNKYCWQKVINIHTRCWWIEEDELSNYMSCWWYKREKELKKKWLFLSACNEEFDNTYRDTYVKVVEDKEYEKLLKDIKKRYKD